MENEKKQDKSILDRVQSAFTGSEKTETVEAPVVKTETTTKKRTVIATNKKNDWQIKDRAYYLKGRKKPLSKMIKSANIYYFDEEKGYERELKYCQNQRTVFVDEMKGDQRLEHIIFRNGSLFVPKEKTVLQKLLSLYHPQKDKIFYEHKPQVIASNQVETIELEIEALNAAQSMDVDMAEAVMRVEIGSKVSEMSSRELKSDTLEPTSTRIIASAISISIFLAAVSASTCISKTSISSAATLDGLNSSYILSLCG